MFGNYLQVAIVLLTQVNLVIQVAHLFGNKLVNMFQKSFERLYLKSAYSGVMKQI